MKRGFPALAAICLASISAAQDRPFVKVGVTPAEIAVGEPIRLRVTVLGPTWFPQPPVFPSFEITNAIVRLPPNSSRATSERIGRETWTGVVRNYRIYPLVDAAYRLDGLTMRVVYADPGSSPVTAEIDVPPIEFQATVPAGAENLDPYMAGRELNLTRTIDGDPASPNTGDALVVTYTAELDGLPAIFLPPLAAGLQIDGVSIYADEPVVENGPPARRTEKLTLVFESGGDVALPGIALDWWNTETGRIETAAVPDLAFSVAGPARAAGKTENPNQRSSLAIAVLALVFILLIILLQIFIPVISKSLREAAAARRQSERYAFEALRDAVAKREPRAVHQALAVWLDRLRYDTDVRRFARDYGDAILQSNVDALSAAIYSDSPKTPDLRGLLKGLVAARRNLLNHGPNAARSALPPLNP